MEFDAVLDSLQTIIDKYRPSHDIIIVGDFNASLFEDRCSRDRKFSYLPWITRRPPPMFTIMNQALLLLTIFSVTTNIKDISMNLNSVENTSSLHPISARIVCNVSAADHTPVCQEIPRRPKLEKV